MSLTVGIRTITTLTLLSLRVQERFPNYSEASIRKAIQSYGHNMRTLKSALNPGGEKGVVDATG